MHAKLPIFRAAYAIALMVGIVSGLILFSVAFVVALLYAMYRFSVSYMTAKKANRAVSKQYMIYAIYSLGIFVVMVLLFLLVRQTPWLLEYIT